MAAGRATLTVGPAPILMPHPAGSAHLVAHWFCKPDVAGSIPAPGSTITPAWPHVRCGAQPRAPGGRWSHCVDLGHSTYVVSSSETVRDFFDTWIGAVELPMDINWQRSELSGHGQRDGIPGVQVATVQIAARCRPAATSVHGCQNS